MGRPISAGDVRGAMMLPYGYRANAWWGPSGKAPRRI